jgi:hypothetical protein
MDTIWERFMTLLKRFCKHWPELCAHLKADKDAPPRRTLALRPTDAGAEQVALDESKGLMNMELAGSGSLNTRGTQLAGLAGATIALVGTLAEKWLSATGGATRTWLGVLIIVSMIALFGAMYCAIFAVLPTSLWRGTLANALRSDLASSGSVDSADLCRLVSQTYLTIAEDQRARNQAKADDMLLSYGFLGAAVLVLLAAAMVFVYSQTSKTSAKSAQPTIQFISRPPRIHHQVPWHEGR